MHSRFKKYTLAICTAQRYFVVYFLNRFRITDAKYSIQLDFSQENITILEQRIVLFARNPLLH